MQGAFYILMFQVKIVLQLLKAGIYANFEKELVRNIFTQYVDSKQRHNNLWRSKSTSNLESMLANRDQQEVGSEAFVDAELFDTMRNTPASDSSRPRSWSPEDSTTRLLLKTQDFGRSLRIHKIQYRLDYNIF